MSNSRSPVVVPAPRPRSAEPAVSAIPVVWIPVHPGTAGVVEARHLTRRESRGIVQLTSKHVRIILSRPYWNAACKFHTPVISGMYALHAKLNATAAADDDDDDDDGPNDDNFIGQR